MLELPDRLFLDLPHALPADAHEKSNFVQRVWALVRDVERAVARGAVEMLPIAAVGEVIPAFGVLADRVRRPVIGAVADLGISPQGGQGAPPLPLGVATLPARPRAGRRAGRSRAAPERVGHVPQRRCRSLVVTGVRRLQRATRRYAGSEEVGGLLRQRGKPPTASSIGLSKRRSEFLTRVQFRIGFFGVAEIMLFRGSGRSARFRKFPPFLRVIRGSSP